MSEHPTRSRRSRLLVPLGLAFVMVGIGSVAAGVSPSPLMDRDGQVAGARDIVGGAGA